MRCGASVACGAAVTAAGLSAASVRCALILASSVKPFCATCWDEAHDEYQAAGGGKKKRKTKGVDVDR